MTKSCLRDPTWSKWRVIAIFSAVFALLLAVGLATTLGVFLVKTECGAPPVHPDASSTYKGSAPPGSIVTYMCPCSLAFEDYRNDFTITCLDDLNWSTTEIPQCVPPGELQCGVSESLTLVTRANNSGVEVELVLETPLPASILEDVYSDDSTKCSYSDVPEVTRWPGGSPFPPPGSLLAKARKTMRDEDLYTLKVIDSNIDPRIPYEVRLRGIGEVVVISLLQEEYVNTVITKVGGETTTTPENTSPTTPTDTHTSENTEPSSATTLVTDATSENTSPATPTDTHTSEDTESSISSTIAITTAPQNSSPTTPTETNTSENTISITTTVITDTTTSEPTVSMSETSTTEIISTTSTISAPTSSDAIFVFTSQSPEPTIDTPTTTTYSSTTIS